MKLVTTEQISGYIITDHLGKVIGNTIRARHLGKDIVAVLRILVGGEIKEYTGMMAESREQAIQRMVEEADAMGADAVVGIRFQTSMIMTSTAELLVYGTAVKIAPDNR